MPATITFNMAFMLMGHMNKVVILAGGKGSRLGDVGMLVPKPMVTVGGTPVIEHIMNSFEDSEFIIATGHKHEVIEDYFRGIKNVKVVFTGLETQTAGRLWRLAMLLDKPFYLCYGDGLTDFNPHLLENNDPQAVVNMLAVHPFGRFGELKFDSNSVVTEFSEKPISDKWINGGYFYVKPDIFYYIDGERDVLETDVFNFLVQEKRLFCYPYEGYWHCMDTPKDWRELEDEYRRGNAKWLRS